MYDNMIAIMRSVFWTINATDPRKMYREMSGLSIVIDGN